MGAGSGYLLGENVWGGLLRGECSFTGRLAVTVEHGSDVGCSELTVGRQKAMPGDICESNSIRRAVQQLLLQLVDVLKLIWSRHMPQSIGASRMFDCTGSLDQQCFIRMLYALPFIYHSVYSACCEHVLFWQHLFVCLCVDVTW